MHYLKKNLSISTFQTDKLSGYYKIFDQMKGGTIMKEMSSPSEKLKINNTINKSLILFQIVNVWTTHQSMKLITQKLNINRSPL